MIKLTRTETIDLPSWEELEKTDKVRMFNNEHIKIYKMAEKIIVQYLTINTSIEIKNEFTKQGYQQAIDKICELGNFKREKE